MRGATDGQRERITVQAHLGEWMARQNPLKPLQHYLRGQERAAKRPERRSVLDMMRRFAAKQDQERPAQAAEGGSPTGVHDGVQ